MVTHGLALRLFLMRWLHWTVDEFLQVGMVVTWIGGCYRL